MSADESASQPTAVPDAVPADDVDALYGLPLDEFTRARDALAKRLRQEGGREAAVWVKGLRKPTAAAWLVNQVARTQTRQARNLIEAADQLRKAHERLLEGGRGSPHDLRAATERHHHAVQDLVVRASGLLDRDGRSPSRSSLDKVAATLQAVAVDDQTREGFAAGRLTREARASGFGGLGLDSAPETERARAPRGKGAKGARSEDRARAREALQKAKAEHRTRQRAVASAERAAEQARQEAERALRRLDEAGSALERARTQEADAATRAADAERELHRRP